MVELQRLELLIKPPNLSERCMFSSDGAQQARNQDFMWGGGGGGANEAKADPTTEMYFLSYDPFI